MVRHQALRQGWVRRDGAAKHDNIRSQRPHRPPSADIGWPSLSLLIHRCTGRRNERCAPRQGLSSARWPALYWCSTYQDVIPLNAQPTYRGDWLKRSTNGLPPATNVSRSPCRPALTCAHCRSRHAQRSRPPWLIAIYQTGIVYGRAQGGNCISDPGGSPQPAQALQLLEYRVCPRVRSRSRRPRSALEAFDDGQDPERALVEGPARREIRRPDVIRAAGLRADGPGPPGASATGRTRAARQPCLAVEPKSAPVIDLAAFLAAQPLSSPAVLALARRGQIPPPCAQWCPQTAARPEAVGRSVEAARLGGPPTGDAETGLDPVRQGATRRWPHRSASFSNRARSMPHSGRGAFSISLARLGSASRRLNLPLSPSHCSGCRISLARVARTVCGWLARGTGVVRWVGLVGRGHVCGV